MESLRKKLGVLREAQRGLQDDIRANAQLGLEVGRSVVLSIIHLFATLGLGPNPLLPSFSF